MSANPKAKEMPTTPTLSPATTAVPQPKSTRIKVPTASARYFLIVPSVTRVESQGHPARHAAPEAIRAGHLCKGKKPFQGRSRRECRRTVQAREQELVLVGARIFFSAAKDFLNPKDSP